MFWTFEWVPDLPISWTNKRDNKKPENWNRLPTFCFARSLYFYKYDFLSLSFHKRTFEHPSRQGSNLAIKDSPLSGMHWRRKTCYIVLFLFCLGPANISTKTRTHGCLKSPDHPLPNCFEHFLLPLLCQGCSYLAPSLLAQQHSNTFPSGGDFTATLESLDHQFCGAGCQRSWW